MKNHWMTLVAGILMLIAGGMALLNQLPGLLGSLKPLGVGEFPVPALSFRIGMFDITTLILAILAVAGGICALMRKTWALALAGAICTLFLNFALGVLSLIFVALSQKEF